MPGNLKLKVVGGPGRGTSFSIPPDGATIGRGVEAQARIDHPSVSRKHCTIYLNKGFWVALDLDSQNGTWVNGERISRQRLAPGDRIQIGDAVLAMPTRVPMAAIIGAAAVGALLVAIVVWKLLISGTPPVQPPLTAGDAGVTVTTVQPAVDGDTIDSVRLHPKMRKPATAESRQETK